MVMFAIIPWYLVNVIVWLGINWQELFLTNYCLTRQQMWLSALMAMPAGDAKLSRGEGFRNKAHSTTTIVECIW